MSEFKVIETQEAFDSAIKERLAREKSKVEEKYKDYDEIKEKCTSYEKQINDLNDAVATATADRDKYSAQVKSLETEKLKVEIARKVGLPYEMANRISGDDEKSMTADAETMKGYFTAHKAEAPLGGSGEPHPTGNSMDDAWLELSQSLDIDD